MKRAVCRWLLCGAVLSALVTCQQPMLYEDESGSPEGSDKIAVQFSGRVQTRMSDNLWEEGDRIGVYMLRTGEGLSKSSVYSGASHRKYLYSSGENAFLPQTHNDTIYYPQKENVDFIAYYPYGSVRNYALTVDVSDQTSPAAIDLLYSNNLRNIAKSEERQSLLFTHKLSKLVFDIRAGEGIDESELEGLSLAVEEIATRGSFNLGSALLTLSEDAVSDVEALVDASGLLAEAIVLPQPCKEKRVRVTLASRRSFTFHISSTEAWEPMKKYTYSIELKKDHYELDGMEGSVEDWDESEGGSLTPSEPSEIDASLWDGTSSETDWYKEEASSFELTTAAQLAGFAALVNAGTDFKDKSVALAADIDLKGHKWTPIGAVRANAFVGTFDGKNHTLRGLSPQQAKGSYAIGLFGNNSGQIRNLTVYGTVVHNSAERECGVAAVVGVNRGTVSGCHSYASVSCTLKGNTVASILYCGGIAGLSYGTIENCSNHGTVKGDTKNTKEKNACYTGGIVGYALANITASENHRAITCKGDSAYAGGIVGALHKAVSIVVGSCRNHGEVTIGSATLVSVAGGVAGRTGGAGTVVTESHNHADVSADISNRNVHAKAGGIAGENVGGRLSGCTSAGLIYASNRSASAKTAAGGITGNNTDGGEIHTCTNQSTVRVQGGTYAGGITGYNGTQSHTANVYGCCTNEGTPSKWIGSAEGSATTSGAILSAHSEP